MGGCQSSFFRDRTEHNRTSVQSTNRTSHNELRENIIVSESRRPQPSTPEKYHSPVVTSTLRVEPCDDVDVTVVNSSMSSSVHSPTSNKNRIIPQNSPISMYKHTEGQVRRGQIVDSEFECTEIFPYLYVGGAKVAQSWSILEEKGITHIINCAASVIPNYFETESVMSYLSLKMVDGRDDDISWFMPDVAQFIYDAMLNGNRMLLHCEKGISRSCSLAIAYHMWATTSTWKQSFNYIKSRRLISNPNTAFTCNLIEIDELLLGDGRYQNIIFRCARHLTTDNTPVLKLCRHQDTRQILTPSTSVLDPRGIFVIRCCQHKSSLVFIWCGRYVPSESLAIAKKLTETMVGVFTKTDAIITTVSDGEETPEFYEYVTQNENFDPEKHRSYTDLWDNEVVAPSRPASTLPTIRGMHIETDSSHHHAKTKSSAISTTSNHLPPLGASPHPVEFIPIDTDRSQQHHHSLVVITKEDAVSTGEGTRDEYMLSHQTSRASLMFSSRESSIGPRDEAFAISDHTSTMTMGMPMIGSTIRSVQPLTPSRPSSSRPQSGRRNPLFTSSSPVPSEYSTSHNPLSPTRQAVRLPNLESAQPVVDNDNYAEAFESASFFTQRPEMSSMHLSLQESDLMLSTSTLSTSDMPRNLSNEMIIDNNNSHQRPSFTGKSKGRLSKTTSPRRLRKPALYQACWNSSRDVYEWQALGVYDDDDLVETSALLLVCPVAPHFLWMGCNFMVSSIMDALNQGHHSPEVICTQWACNDVDMSQLNRDKKISYMLPLTRLEISFERDGYESDMFWEAFSDGY